MFADATNSCAKDTEDGIDESDFPIMKLKAASTGRVKRGPLKKRMKVEVVIPAIMQRELEVDVFN